MCYPPKSGKIPDCQARRPAYRRVFTRFKQTFSPNPILSFLRKRSAAKSRLRGAGIHLCCFFMSLQSGIPFPPRTAGRPDRPRG
jgi:hypothetical protein